MISPTDFVNQAEKLINPITNPTEVDCRSAISRAYYYLLHESFVHLRQTHGSTVVQSIRDYLDSKGESYDIVLLTILDRSYLKTLKVNLHGTIPNVLRRLHRRRIARDFDSFRDDRNDADYQLDMTFPLTEATTKISEMKRLVSTINAI